MAQITVNRLTNANIYVNGSTMLGKAEEVSLPAVKFMMAEHKALGMIGKMEFPSGIDKLEAKIKWNSFYADAMKTFGSPFKNLQIQVRANLETYDSTGRSTQVPVICYITAAAKDFPMGNFKQHDNVELESNLSVYYVKLAINGGSIVEIDVLANIWKVDGVDQLSTYRANLGA